MKNISLLCSLGLLLVILDSHAQSQRLNRSVTILCSAPQRTSRATAAGTGHRSITATITVPGRSVGRSWAGSQWAAAGSLNIYTYDAQGNNTQIVQTDSATNAPDTREFYTYNARKQVTEFVDQHWINSAYVNDEREQYTYDAQGNLTLELYQQWRNGAWSTQYGYRTTNTYNSANVLTGQMYEELNTNTNLWELDERATYTVKASNQWTEVVYQNWSNGAYVNNERIRNITWYDWTKLLPSYVERQEWRNGAWVDDQRSTVTYQPNGSNVEVQQQSTAPNIWVNDDRITTTYDNFGNLILDQVESWNSSNTWVIVGADRTLLSYTAGNQVRRAVEQNYNTSLNRYENSYLTTYGSFVTLGTRRASGLEATATLHPNPTIGTTTLSLRGLRDQGSLRAEVINTLGQVVQMLSVRPHQGAITQQISLTNLPAGVYTVRLHTLEGTVVKRVVKQ